MIIWQIILLVLFGGRTVLAQNMTPAQMDAMVAKVLPGVQAAHSKGMIPIVRVGVQMDAGGMEKPENLVTFARALGGKVSNKVYIVAGPNEPETELWAAPGCGDGDGACIGPKVAAYMNSVVSNSVSNISWMSPVFNLCSPVFPGLIGAMGSANWGGVAAIGVNVYNGTPTGGDSTINACLSNRLGMIPSGAPVIITETGAFDGNFDGFKNEIQNLSSRVMGALLFNGLNTNPDWSRFSLSDAQINQLDKSRLGVNFATNYTSGDYERAGSLGLKFTLEILSGGSGKPRKTTPDNNGVPILSYGKMLGASGGAKGLSSKFVEWFSKKTADNNPQTGQKVTINGGASSGSEDFSINHQLGNPQKPGQGFTYNSMSIKQPPRYLDIKITALSPRTIVDAMETLQHDVIGFAPKYREVYEDFVGPNSQNYMEIAKSVAEVQRRTQDYKAGIASQAIPEVGNSDEHLKDWLCRLGASNIGEPYLADKQTRPVSDFDIADSSGKTAYETAKNMLPNGQVDWSKDYSPIRASSVYCAMGMGNKCGGKYGPQSLNCGNVVAIPSSGKLFEVYKSRVKEHINVPDNFAGKAFIETSVDVNDPGLPDNEKKSCEELMGTPYGRKLGLADPGDEIGSNFISRVGWAGMDDKTRHNLLTLDPKKSGYFFVSPNGAKGCWFTIVTPITIPNLTTAWGASNVAMNLLPQSEKDKIKTPPSVSYIDADTSQVMDTDKSAKLGIINQPVKDKEVYHYEPATGNRSGDIRNTITRELSFPRNMECPEVTVHFDTGELGTDAFGVPSAARDYTFRPCRQSYQFKIDMRLHVPNISQTYAKQIETFAYYMMPEKEKVKFLQKQAAENGGKPKLDSFDIGMRLGAKQENPDDKALARIDMAGDGGYYTSSSEIRDKNTLKATSVFVNESKNDLLREAFKNVLPQKWQQEWFKYAPGQVMLEPTPTPNP